MRFGDTPLFAPPEAQRLPESARSGRPAGAATAAEAGTGAIRLTTLGRLGASDAAGSALGVRRKDLVLLAYLARRAPRAGTRQELASLFWEGRDEARARHSLRQALVQLRGIAGDAVRSDEELVWLTAGAVEVDASQFERHAMAGRHREAVRCHGGLFLNGVESSGGAKLRHWVLEERASIELQYVRSIQALLRESLTYQRWAEAVVWAERWAEADPLSEEAHLHLAESLHFAGRTEAALAVHATFRARLKAERGEVPSAAFARLRDRLQRESLTRDSLAPSADSRAVTVPAFVGREEELRRLMDVWSAVRIASAVATVIVLGPEGVGKTRLVEELLRRLAEDPAVTFFGRGCRSAEDRPEAHAEPYATARSIFAGLVAAPGLSATSPADLAEVATVLPGFRDRFAELPASDGDEARVHQAFVRVLAEITYQLPVIVAIDDLYCADPATRRLVGHIRAHAPAGLYLVVTGREDDPFESEAPAVVRSVRIRLGGLAGTEVEAMLASMLSLGDEPLQVVAGRITVESGGNPRRVGTLLRAMVDDGWLVPDPWGQWRLGDGSATRPAQATPSEPEPLPQPGAAKETQMEVASLAVESPERSAPRYRMAALVAILIVVALLVAYLAIA